MAAFEVIALDTATPQLRAPGASDTYTFPRAVEMPLGTANGVLYLDGSKVVTSGSALTFDGTTFGWRITRLFATSKHFVGTLLQHWYLSFCKWNRHSDNNPLLVMYVGCRKTALQILASTGTEQMRLTSTGLGIGTSSPGNKLHGKALVMLPDLPTVQIAPTGWILHLHCLLAQDTGNGLYAKASDWYSCGQQSVKATLDSSGNLGLGVTPSAWGSGTTALEVGAVYSKLSSSGTYGGALTNNAYYNSGWKYEGANFATLYLTAGGVHSWHTAASGTAGDAISFTQAMTLDASGICWWGRLAPNVAGLVWYFLLLQVAERATGAYFKIGGRQTAQRPRAISNWCYSMAPPLSALLPTVCRSTPPLVKLTSWTQQVMQPCSLRTMPKPTNGSSAPSTHPPARC
jgi:hypothetical protein